MGSASGRRRNCGPAFLVNVYALSFLLPIITSSHPSIHTTLVSLSHSLSDDVLLDSSLALYPSFSKFISSPDTISSSSLNISLIN
jgi:hypothetical protein